MSTVRYNQPPPPPPPPPPPVPKPPLAAAAPVTPTTTPQAAPKAPPPPKTSSAPAVGRGAARGTQGSPASQNPKIVSFHSNTDTMEDESVPVPQGMDFVPINPVLPSTVDFEPKGSTLDAVLQQAAEPETGTDSQGFQAAFEACWSKSAAAWTAAGKTQTDFAKNYEQHVIQTFGENSPEAAVVKSLLANYEGSASSADASQANTSSAAAGSAQQSAPGTPSSASAPPATASKAAASTAQKPAAGNSELAALMAQIKTTDLSDGNSPVTAQLNTPQARASMQRTFARYVRAQAGGRPVTPQQLKMLQQAFSRSFGSGYIPGSAGADSSIDQAHGQAVASFLDENESYLLPGSANPPANAGALKQDPTLTVPSAATTPNSVMSAPAVSA